MKMGGRGLYRKGLYMDQSTIIPHFSIPWRELLTSPPVYAFILTHIFHNYGFLVLSLAMPRFMREAMQFSLNEIGILSSAPFLGSLCSKLICTLGCSYVEGLVGPHLSCMRRVLYASCTALTMGFLGVVIFASCEHRSLVLLMCVLLGATSDLGFSGGYWPTLLYFAPSFAGLLSGLSNCLGHLSGFMAPYVIGALVQTGIKAEWDFVLLTLILFNGLALLTFGFFGSSELQSWDPRSNTKAKETN